MAQAAANPARGQSAFWLCFALVFGGAAYLAWCWYTYSGPYRWLARTQMALFGSYDGTLTGLLQFVPLILPAVLMERLAASSGRLWVPGARRLAGKGAALPSEPADPLRAQRTAMRVTGALAAVCLLVSAVFGGLAWQHATRDPSVARLDLARPPAVLPEADQYEVSGTVRPDLAVQWTETIRGYSTRQLFLPLVAPDWRRGEPVRVVLRIEMHSEAVVLYDQRRQAMVRLDRPAPYTTRPAAVLGGPGSLLSSPLPGAVADRWTSQGQPLAPDLAVLDEAPGAGIETYAVPAAVAGVIGFFLLVAAGGAAWRARKLARG